MFRSLTNEPYCSANLELMSEEIGTLMVCRGSPAEGRTLAELELEALGIKPLAVHRGNDTLSNPDKNYVLSADEIIILLGPEEKIHKIAELFSNNPK